MVLMHHSWITSLAARLLSKSHVTEYVSPKTWEYTVFFSRTSFYKNILQRVYWNRNHVDNENQSDGRAETIVARKLALCDLELRRIVIPPNSNTFPDWRRTCHLPLVKTQWRPRANKTQWRPRETVQHLELWTCTWSGRAPWNRGKFLYRSAWCKKPLK